MTSVIVFLVCALALVICLTGERLSRRHERQRRTRARHEAILAMGLDPAEWPVEESWLDRRSNA